MNAQTIIFTFLNICRFLYLLLFFYYPSKNYHVVPEFCFQEKPLFKINKKNLFFIVMLVTHFNLHNLFPSIFLSNLTVIVPILMSYIYRDRYEQFKTLFRYNFLSRGYLYLLKFELVVVFLAIIYYYTHVTK